jgi:deltex
VNHGGSSSFSLLEKRHLLTASSYVLSKLQYFLTQFSVHVLEKSLNGWTQETFVRLFSSERLLRDALHLIQTQEQFRSAGKPTAVDIGFHYTHEENLANIRLNGLLSMKERNSRKIKPVKDNGKSFGEGVYTSANPTAFHGRYGTSGILVLRLLGKNGDVESNCRTSKYDSVTVNRHQVQEIVVLSSGRQCIPIFSFDSSHIDLANPLKPGNLTLDKCQFSLQAFVDRVFNRSCDASSPFYARVPRPPRSVYETVRYIKPSPWRWKLLDELCLKDMQEGDEMPAVCGICLCECTLDSPVVQIDWCKHVFHRSCIAHVSPACPVCCKAEARSGLLGKMPSGKMVIRCRPMVSGEGASTTGVIVIEYVLPGDVQDALHRNPGVPFTGTHRQAFLPDDPDGHNLLKRLKYAFSHGLTFKVGKSMTTGRDNVITWFSISHKTSLTGGAQRFGYPDPNYFAVCNHQLDALCVPVASELL